MYSCEGKLGAYVTPASLNPVTCPAYQLIPLLFTKTQLYVIQIKCTESEQ